MIVDTPSLPKRIIRSTFWSMLICLVGAACQREGSVVVVSMLAPTVSATTVPQPTASLAPTVAFTITPSPTPTSQLPATIVPSTPGLPASSYKLREWSESDSAAFIARVFELNRWNDLNHGSVADSELAFEAERLLRFPQSLNWIDVAWETARTDPRGIATPNVPFDKDLFSFLVEHWLNDENGEVTNLSTLLDSRGFQLLQSVSVGNLFGDGQDSMVFVTRVFNHQGFGEYSAMYAIRKVSGNFALYALNDWLGSGVPTGGTDYSIHAIGDSNGNGLSQVLIDSESNISDNLNTYGAEWVEIYEWDAHEELFVSYELDVYGHYCNAGPCEGKWEFGLSGENGVRQLTLTEYLFTTGDFKFGDSLEGRCPNLEIQRVYQWDGVQYAFQNEVLAPPPDNPPECRVTWAVAAIRYHGWQDDQAITILQDALKNWPDVMDENWGPVSRDYFRLQTALWLDARGEGEAAVALLQPLANNPTYPQYELPSDLAASYLQIRSQYGAAVACIHIQVQWVKVIQEEIPYYALYTDIQKLVQDWGFGGDRWGKRIEDLCDRFHAANVALLPKFASTEELTGWLNQIGIDLLAVQPADLNGDGIDDWLVLNNGYVWCELWAYLQTPDGVEVRYAGSIPKDEGINNVDLNWNSFQPTNDVVVINVLLINGYLRTFFATSDFKIKTLISEFGVTDIDYENGLKMIVTKVDENGHSKVIRYAWDAISQQLVKNIDAEVATPADYDFNAAEQEAERLLFHEQDFPATIAFIQKFLVEAPPEPLRPDYSFCDGSQCFQPNWYRPYLRYMLGIAYELHGQPDEAVSVYYQLWSDEPDSIFGIAASLKLEVKQ